jgi:hypothetical protein
MGLFDWLRGKKKNASDELDLLDAHFQENSHRRAQTALTHEDSAPTKSEGGQRLIAQSEAERRAEGRIKVEANIIRGAPDRLTTS